MKSPTFRRSLAGPAACAEQPYPGSAYPSGGPATSRAEKAAHPPQVVSTVQQARSSEPPQARGPRCPAAILFSAPRRAERALLGVQRHNGRDAPGGCYTTIGGSWLAPKPPPPKGPAFPEAEDAGAPGGPRQPRADRCPPPPRTLPPGACQAVRCQADSECPRHRRCCYNGCAYACLEAVPPPPVLDWLVQPKPRWLGGNGWLLDGPEEVLQAEACSTTEDGAEPLLCPSGYECHILSPGDVAEGIPNRGQCVKQRRPADGRILRHRFYKEYPEGDSKNVAEPGRGQQRHFQ
nr:WAP four-disulfide core domain protein 1 [Microcebus murinus]